MIYKKILVVLLVLFTARIESVLAVDCTPAEIQLFTQSDVDNFESNHGSNCSVITGNLTIGPVDPDTGNSDIDNVDNLSDIVTINGNLTIRNNTLLTDIHGLMNLTAVGGDVEIVVNESLSNCESLNVLLDGNHDGDLHPALPLPDVRGELLLGENAEGCQSLEDIAPTPLRTQALTGSWYFPVRPGVGFMWHAVSDELAVAYYYGFTDKEGITTRGDRFWLIGIYEGPVTWNEIITFEASYITGGDFDGFSPEQITENYFGTMTLFPVGCDATLLEITGSFPDAESQDSYRTTVERLAPVAGFECYQPNTPTHPTDGLTGSWFDPDTSGQGFSIHKVDEDTGIVYFYGFDRAGEPLWLIGVWDETIEFGKEFTLTMNEVSGGRFLFFSEDWIEEYEWGVLQIRFDDCTHGWASMLGADGAQEFELELLAGSAGLDCQQ